MPNFEPFSFHRILPRATFEALGEVLQQMAQLPNAIWLSEEWLTPPINSENYPQFFRMVVSEKFSALLSAKNVLDTEQFSPDSSTLLKVGLSFEEDAIATFLHDIKETLKTLQSPVEQKNLKLLHKAQKMLRTNDARWQSEFTLKLLETLSIQVNSITRQNHPDQQEDSSCLLPPIFSEKDAPFISICHPIEDTLKKQLEQEKILTKVTSLIDKHLELPIILSTAIEEVRQYIQVDRLLIYQFKNLDILAFQEKPDLEDNIIDQTFNIPWGRVTYESKANDSIISVLNLTEGSESFPAIPNYREKYRKGYIQAIADVTQTYIESPCLLELMERCQIRSKLIVPIVVRDELWGLLIANNCTYREWEEQEKKFLSQMAEHIAIAIFQGELYQELKQQKHTLEQRVMERTQALGDALVAAESANRAKTEFLAIMSHELRTPLTCVMGISSTLLRWSFGQSGTKPITLEKQRGYLQNIHDYGEQLLELINDLLDLSQVESGNAILNISEFSLVKLAYSTFRSMQEKALLKGVNLVLDQQLVQGREYFRADRDRVKQILFNLLSNAIKFTPSGGTVTLRVWQERNNAFWQIEDTGIGISEEQRSLLFQKFQQLDSPYRRQYGGTGLGLALTKQLVELHGGTIEVESTLDLGSIFTVKIPSKPQINKPLLNQAKPNTSPEESLSHHHYEKPQSRLILIEENEEIAQIICDLLTAAGYQVVWIIEASTAVEQIELLQPVAVIIDMRLPGRSGSEIIGELRHKTTTKKIKILALTSNLEQEYNRNSSHPNDYLLKPIKPENLLHKIHTLLRNNKDN
jgi:two-component system, sensor histidine kinase and response regulator